MGRDRVARRVAEPWHVRTVDHITYWQVGNYLVTLVAGQQYQVVIHAHIGTVTGTSIAEWLDSREVRRRYQLNGAQIGELSLWLSFRNNWWASAKIQELVELVISRLQEAGAAGVDCCSYCMQPFASEDSRIVEAFCGVAYAWHPDCVLALQQEIREREKEEQAQLPPAWRGQIGALLGTIVGALLGALILWYLGGYVGVAGLLAGLLCCGLPALGYRLLGGRRQSRLGFRSVAAGAAAGLLLAHSLGCLLPVVQWLQVFGAFYGRTWADVGEICLQRLQAGNNLAFLISNLLTSVCLYAYFLLDLHAKTSSKVTFTPLS